jgi:hypothetical protein
MREASMLTRKAKYFLSLSAAVPLLFAAACTDNNIFDPRTDAVGTYDLTIFAGNTLPVDFTVQPCQNVGCTGANDDPDLPNGGNLRVTGGTMVLRNDGTFLETNIYIKTPPGGSSFESDFISNGTFTVNNGGSVQFSAPAQNGFGPRVFNGTISQDGRINYTEGQSQYEYRR